MFTLLAIITRILKEVCAHSSSYGKLVAAVVLHRRGVSLNPDEAHVVSAIDSQEAHPEVGVLLPHKTLTFPAKHPLLVHRLDNILRVGVECYV